MGKSFDEKSGGENVEDEEEPNDPAARSVGHLRNALLRNDVLYVYLKTATAFVVVCNIQIPVENRRKYVS